MEHLQMNTRALEINGHKFCAYCGEQIPFDEIWDKDTRISEYFYHCDCEDAKKEIEIKKKIRSLETEIISLKRDFPREKYEVGAVPIKKKA